MSLTINTKTYSSFRAQADSNALAGPANTATVKDLLTLRRQFPKATKDSAGVARPGIKIVKTLTLADTTKKDMIIDISASVPVGAVDADVLLVLDDLADTLDMQDAKDLFTKLDINA
jgi:hypothetical protein